MVNPEIDRDAPKKELATDPGAEIAEEAGAVPKDEVTIVEGAAPGTEMIETRNVIEEKRTEN